MEALNQSLALVLWNQDRDGNDDVAVFSGILIEEAELYYLARENGVKPEIRREWLPRIQAIPEEWLRNQMAVFLNHLREWGTKP